jgi:predicted transcriptional regulator
MRVQLNTPHDMEYIRNIGKILASEVRLRMIFLLQSGEKYNMSEMGKILSLTSRSISRHAKMMAKYNILEIEFEKNGLPKLCSLKDTDIQIDLSGLLNGKPQKL